jgi:hypothetical protein
VGDFGFHVFQGRPLSPRNSILVATTVLQKTEPRNRAPDPRIIPFQGFVSIFIWKMIAIEPRSVMEAKRWIGRIVFGTIGVEMAGLLVRVLVDSVTH